MKGTLLESFADMRKWFGQDFNPHLSELKLSRLSGYIDGYLAARNQHGSPDALVNQFFGWLATKRGGGPFPEGLEASFRRDFKGDEVAAIRELLDLAAEFTRLQGGPQGSPGNP